MGEKKSLMGFLHLCLKAPNKQWRASQEGDSEVGTVRETDLKGVPLLPNKLSLDSRHKPLIGLRLITLTFLNIAAAGAGAREQLPQYYPPSLVTQPIRLKYFLGGGFQHVIIGMSEYC